MDAAKLAALVSSRICHDLVSPVSSLSMVLGALNDPDMGSQAESVIGSAAKSIEQKLTFLRYAMGSVGLQSGAADMHEAKGLIDGYLSGYKSELDWKVTAPLSYAQTRLLMNMVMLAAAGMARGGVISADAQVDGGNIALDVVGVGKRAGLSNDLKMSLNGQEPEGGWQAKIIQPYFARLIAAELGGEIALEEAAISDEQSQITLNCKLAV